MLLAARRGVTRDDKAGVTRYQLRLPLATLGLEPGQEFGFNVVFFDGFSRNWWSFGFSPGGKLAEWRERGPR
jgi:hypothetical protein